MSGQYQFEKQQFLNIETFRKNGKGVRTPVWFVQDGETLYVWTETDSGKAKRIRNNGKVMIAPSKADGSPIGEWASATARVDNSEQALKKVRLLMGKKYGFMFSLFALFGRIRRSDYTCVQLQTA